MKNIRYILLAVIVAGFTFLSAQKAIETRTEYFIKDFVDQWATFRLFLDNKNPYDVLELKKAVLQTGYIDPLFAYSNSPLSLAIMSPVLMWDLNTGMALCIFINLILYGLSCKIAWKLFSGPQSLSFTFILFSGLCIVPFVSVLASCQFGILVSFSCLMTFYCLKHKKGFAAGFFMMLIQSKPHLLYLVSLLLVLDLLRNKNWKPLVSFTFFMMLLIITTHLHAPKVFAQWFASLDRALTNPYRSATLINGLIGLFQHASMDILWLKKVALPLSIIGSLIYFIKNPKIDWNRALPGLACLSLLTIPYAWIHDLSVFMIPQLALIAGILGTSTDPAKRLEVLFLLLVFHLISVAGVAIWDIYFFYCTYALTFCLIWIYGRKKSPDQGQPSEALLL